MKLTRMFEPLKTETTKLIRLVVSNRNFEFSIIYGKTTNQKLIPFKFGINTYQNGPPPLVNLAVTYQSVSLVGGGWYQPSTPPKKVFPPCTYLAARPTNRKWVNNPSYKWDLCRVNPLIIGVITHLLSGMSHQV